MKVGITGHQNLGSKETITWLSDVLATVVHKYGIDMGITSLAIGADQLYAQILRKKDIRYLAIIPSDQYEKTFANTSDLEKYNSLLHDASEVIKLPFNAPSEVAFYEAGKHMVNLSDMVIAIWDGQPAKGLGGTGDVVHYAHLAKKSILHINPTKLKVRLNRN